MGRAIIDILTVAAMLFGLFFLVIGALGLWRLPDVYNRMHAASKCVTLGISGLLVAAVLCFAAQHAAGGDEAAWESLVGAATRALLVIVFQFTAAPVGAHMLARAAHVDGAARWKGTLDDELARDRADGAPPPDGTAV